MDTLYNIVLENLIRSLPNEIKSDISLKLQYGAKYKRGCKKIKTIRIDYNDFYTIESIIVGMMRKFPQKRFVSFYRQDYYYGSIGEYKCYNFDQFCTLLGVKTTELIEIINDSSCKGIDIQIGDYVMVIELYLYFLEIISDPNIVEYLGQTTDYKIIELYEFEFKELYLTR